MSFRSRMVPSAPARPETGMANFLPIKEQDFQRGISERSRLFWT